MGAVVGGWAAAGLVVAYAALAARARRSGRRWAGWRTWSFGSGTALAAAALALGGDGRFSRHAVEHLVLVMAAPLLVVAARPLSLALIALPGGGRRRLAATLRRGPARLALHPVVVWGSVVLAPWVLWFTPLYRWSLDHGVVHGLVHLHLLAAGLLFAAVVVGLDGVGRPLGHPARALAVGLTLPLHALLGLVVLSLARPTLNPSLAPAEGLSDQRLGAALIWLGGDLLASVAVAVVVGRWLAAERRRAVVLDGGLAEAPPSGRPATVAIGTEGRPPPAD